MRNKTIDHLIMLLLVLSGTVSWVLYFREFRQADTVNIHAFPREIAGWKSEEIPITEHEYAILETKNAFTRKYTDTTGRAVYLFVVYSQTNRKVAHPPEICYTGSGATIIAAEPALIQVEEPPVVIRANKLLVEKGDYHQYMYYWFKVGNYFTSNYWRQQILIGLNTISGKPAGSALIRLSSDVEKEGQATASGAVEEFTRLITPLIFQYLP